MMKNKRIAIFANAWSNEYLRLLIEDIRREASRDDVDVFVFATYIYWSETGIQSDRKLNVFRLANPDDYDGVIMMTNTFNSEVEKDLVLRMFEGRDIPIISTEVKLPGIAYIGSSNYEGMSELAEHLVTEHHVKRVVFVGGTPGNLESSIRRKALEDVLGEHGLSIMDSFDADFAFRSAANQVIRYLNSGKELPDAFVCANDHMALGIISILHKRGIEVPEDVIVTGFDQVYEAQTSFPLISTVSRQWDRMGGYIYRNLKRMMETPDPDLEFICRTRFFPSESCGCEPDAIGVGMRKERIRNLYERVNRSSSLDQFFQSLFFEVSTIENKEEFHEVAGKQFAEHDFVGRDFCICTEPDFFSVDDDLFLHRGKGFSDEMDALIEVKDGILLKQRPFPSWNIYPGYHKGASGSDIYVVAPLTSREYGIGYVVVKNCPQVLYDLDFQKWCANVGTVLYTIRQYIFAQQTNRKLREIYMSDALTEMYNRTGCENVIFPYIEEKKQQGESTVLLFVDINRMKLINDGYGHLSGDLAIRATARGMKDSFGEDWLFGRYGGDEFIAVGNYVDDETVSKYRDSFREQMDRIKDRLKVNFPLSASVGCAVIRPDDTRTVEDFIREADESMYEQKEIAHREWAE